MFIVISRDEDVAVAANDLIVADEDGCALGDDTTWKAGKGIPLRHAPLT